MSDSTSRPLLEEFAEKWDISGPGSLSVVLVVTDVARGLTPPFDPKTFLTDKGGQVAKLSERRVLKILAKHSETRFRCSEAGRTSRGSIERMREYLKILNAINAQHALDFDEIEAFWVQKVGEYLDTEPLTIRADTSKSLRKMVAELLEVAIQRQKQRPGTTIAGTVLEHLVGAKLALALPEGLIEHKGATVADQQQNMPGDFLVNDTAIHVTTSPGELLMRKCKANLDNGLRPIIVTIPKWVQGAHSLAEDFEIADRIEVFDAEQFIAMNVYEWSRFGSAERQDKVLALVEMYNRIIDQVEHERSLRIALQ